jgi:hypothetical protein
MRRRLALLLLVPALVLGACGDDDDDGGDAAGDATTTSVADGEMVLTANLVGGAAEVPDGGDPDGSGRATVSLKASSNEVCFDVTATNIAAPTLGHIHEGAASVAGPVVVNIADPARAVTSPPLKACTAGVDRALIARIAANPSGFYVNLHTADYPKGAIRGQLAAA